MERSSFGRFRRRHLRTAALVVFLGGLVLFQLYARNREVPLVRVNEITPAMNFSKVRISGVLDIDARRLRSDAVLYMIDDGTGTIAAFLNRPAEKELLRAGSRVEVAGNLSVGTGNNVRLRATSVKVLSAAKGLASVSAEQEGERLSVSGRVSNIWHPDPGSRAPHKIILADADGKLSIVHWLPDVPEIRIGDRLKVRGSVSVYKGSVQLKVWDAADIQLLE